jgi:hypothetical protein
LKSADEHPRDRYLDSLVGYTISGGKVASSDSSHWRQAGKNIMVPIYMQGPDV